MSIFRRIILSDGLDIDIDIDSLPETQKIYYTATSSVSPNRAIGFIIANNYNNDTGEGVLCFKSDVRKIRSSAFAFNNFLTSITIPNTVTSIEDYAFQGCSSLTEFKGKYASEDGRCLIKDGKLIAFAPAGLSEYTIPNSVTEIGNSVFYGCSSLTSITIPNSVTSIGYGAFFGCSSLTSITIPNSVTSIGDDAFWYCPNLTNVYCKATTPPALGGTTVFYPNVSGRKIYVPTESVGAYKSVAKWNDYYREIEGYNFKN